MRPYTVSSIIKGVYPGLWTAYVVHDGRSMDVTPHFRDRAEASEWCDRLNEAYEQGRRDEQRATADVAFKAAAVLSFTNQSEAAR